MAQALTYKGTRARRRSTRGDGVGDGAPREICGEGGDRGSIVADGCRFFASRAARASVDVGSNGRGPSLCLGEPQARRAHNRTVGVLHPPGCPRNLRVAATTYSQKKAQASRRFNDGTVRNPRSHLYTFIGGAPPDAADRQQM